MTAMPFRQDQKLTDVLTRQKFTFSAEVIPPRNGSEQGKLLQQIEKLIQAGAQFLAVTKGAGGSLRGGSLPIAQAIKERFSVPCIAHFTCRDLTPFEVENQLMDHHYFGIRNILALRGDPPDGQPQWQAREGGYNFAYELIEQIRKMNQGEYIPRAHGPQADGSEKTDFCIGAAAYPDFPNERDRIEFFRLKIVRGAEFGITDMLFDPDSYGRFLDQCGKVGIHVPILAGTRLLKSQTQARKMIEKFKVHIPPSVFNQLPEVAEVNTQVNGNHDALSRSIELFLKMTERLKQLGAPGVHLYVISDTQGACAALQELTRQEVVAHDSSHSTHSHPPHSG